MVGAGGVVRQQPPATEEAAASSSLRSIEVELEQQEEEQQHQHQKESVVFDGNDDQQQQQQQHSRERASSDPVISSCASTASSSSLSLSSNKTDKKTNLLGKNQNPPLLLDKFTPTNNNTTVLSKASNNNNNVGNNNNNSSSTTTATHHQSNGTKSNHNNNTTSLRDSIEMEMMMMMPCAPSPRKPQQQETQPSQPPSVAATTLSSSSAVLTAARRYAAIEEKKEDGTVASKTNAVRSEAAAVREARRGLLRTMMEHFSSTPITDPPLPPSPSSNNNHNNNKDVLTTTPLKNKLNGRASPTHPEDEDDEEEDDVAEGDFSNILQSATDRLTTPEKEYLQELLRNGDIDSLHAARMSLSDPTLFPPKQMLPHQQQQDQQQQQQQTQHPSDPPEKDDPIMLTRGDTADTDDTESEHKREEISLPRLPPSIRRDGHLQQQLFKLHESNTRQAEQKQLQQQLLLDHQSDSILFQQNQQQPPTSSSLLQRMALVHRNSILDGSSEADPMSDHSINTQSENNHNYTQSGEPADPPGCAIGMSSVCSIGMTSEQLPTASMFDGTEIEGGIGGVMLPTDEAEAATDEDDEFGIEDPWENPFKEMSTWLDGGEGVEVNPSGVPLPNEPKLAVSTSLFGSRRASPFKILGTTADDVSCHPHVLSPPCMESLLAFVPESLMESSNFWLKYSLVRDGASLWKLLRQVRASQTCFLAIETMDGHVFGAFTSSAWRISQGWYGSNEAFLWKMRRSRLEARPKSLREQVCRETEIQVYPYRTGNVAVQYCSKDCLMMGQGELLPTFTKRGGKHYGHAIYLENDLLKGSTSTSETFGNPCFVDAQWRGARFEVSNLEVWTLTPHETVQEAEQSELSMMFLEGGRASNHKNLNFMDILVGGPI